MIKPTVGRVVWFHPGPGFVGAFTAGEPLPAFITKVWSDTGINVGGFDANGKPFGATSVLLVQEGAPRPSYSFAEWMPYQLGQAAKAEAGAKAGPPWREVAAAAYRAYGASTGNKNFRGDPMPAFDDLPRGIQVAWEAAVRHADDFSAATDPSAVGVDRWAGWTPDSPPQPPSQAAPSATS